MAFLGLALTGLPLKYSHTEWAKAMAAGMGGFASTSFWHRFFAVITFGCLVDLPGAAGLLVRGRPPPRRVVLGLVFGPDSPVPNCRDFKDFFAMLRWFCRPGPQADASNAGPTGRSSTSGAPRPTSSIIGSTGLVLWFPNFFCRFLPGIGVEHRPGDPLHPGPAGDGIRLRHPLLQHASSARRSSPPTCRC